MKGSWVPDKHFAAQIRRLMVDLRMESDTFLLVHGGCETVYNNRDTGRRCQLCIFIKTSYNLNPKLNGSS